MLQNISKQETGSRLESGRNQGTAAKKSEEQKDKETKWLGITRTTSPEPMDREAARTDMAPETSIAKSK